MEKSSVELTEEDLAKFDWLSLHKEMDEKLPQESKFQKLIRKCKDNPFVPIGTAVTTAALVYGIWNFKVGNRKVSQYMMRTRVAAQGFTVLALVGGFIYGTGKK